ncbi:hypothetical protein HC231_01355 [Brenneria izadpanahii]|uniref:DUF3955 domain-containing protein n=1 Tax=Brenneria izadpanahii TaxID=2722756 RepID=A0ABX7UMF3_9GAMM|nr:hypothetical protein [Brenneria izadpanahii]QTF06728.1 hypothetical protein HC231_01355 [Brenneria izadpanahii]
MKAMKLLIFILCGSVLGGVIMLVLFPSITDYFVGPIYGEDQMSLNATIFFIGMCLCIVGGGIIGGLFGRYKLKD